MLWFVSSMFRAPRVYVLGWETEAVIEIEETNGGRHVARLAAPVLQYLGDHPGVRLSPAEVGRLATSGPEDGARLGAWLERAGLLEGDPDEGYALAARGGRLRRGSRGLILLVEDHASIAGMTETLLSSEGYTVIIVRNPLEAHALLRALRFDMILTDSFGPTLELAVRVLGPLLRRSAGTPVVLFTTHHWDPTRVQAEGFTDIVPQPFTVEPFLTRIDQLAAQRHAVGRS